MIANFAYFIIAIAALLLIASLALRMKTARYRQNPRSYKHGRKNKEFLKKVRSKA